jgi:hypothetical protein
MPSRKSVAEQAIAKIGKRPISAPDLAKKMGLPNHNGLARPLGKAAQEGRIIKTDKGYTKA